MDFRIAKDELVRALGRVQGIVDKRSTNPIIGNVLIDVDPTGMRVSATDTEMSLVCHYTVQCEVPGRITLNARQLYDMARLAPAESVAFRLADGSVQVEIVSGRSYFRMLGLPAAEFPLVPDPGAISGFDIDGAALKDLIDRTLFAVSTDDTRAGLNGAHVETWTAPGGATLLRFVATDGHRLSLCGRPFQGDPGLVRTVLLPRKGLVELRKLADDASGPITVQITENQAIFQRGPTTFSMRLLEGEFPDYQMVIPPTWQRRVLASKEALTQCLRRVSIVTSEKTNPVRFVIRGGALTVVARQPELGEAREDVEAQLEGADLEVGFNAKYFQEALGALSSDTAAIEIGDSLSPCLIRPGEGSSDELFVIMPMRLD
jgi:DNA polymerase-3 subunit beta